MKCNFKSTVRIGPLELGRARPPLVVAEIGGNHGGDPRLARRMIDAAEGAGAKAVKFQAYRTGSFLRRASGYYDELAAEELGPCDLSALAEYARGRGLLFLTSVFDFESLDLAAGLDLPAVKIASGDLNNLPLLEAAAALDKPIILSTGAAGLDEIDEALDLLGRRGGSEVVLLQCTALYPCPDEEINLRVIPALYRRYEVPVGFSDHSLGFEIPLAAMALGAVLVEKHFTTDRRLPGGDNGMSCLPDELGALVRGAERLALALGRPDKEPTPGEFGTRTAIRRSIVAACKVRAGQVLGRKDLGIKRPGQGLAPAEYFRLLGRKAAVDLEADEAVTWEKVL